MKIDGRDVAVDKGMTVMDGCRKLGIYVPHFCYHPALSIAGSCRLCMVEVKGFPKPMISCNTPADAKYEVFTGSEMVVQARKAMMEFFLLNHPLDCPVCDQAGECDLQDFSFRYGRGFSRYDEGKEPRAKKDVGRDILLYTQRCVLCTRCTRFLDEVSGTNELTVANRGFHSEIVNAPGKRADNLMAGNITDICPVGALESKDFLFKSRVWYLHSTPSVCTHCPAGCNIKIQTKGNRILRIKPRTNLDVNGYFMCDIGRFGYKFVNDSKRLTGASRRVGAASANGVPARSMISIGDAIETVAESLASAAAAGSVAAIASPWMTNEEAYLLARIFKDCLRSSRVAMLEKNDRATDVRFKKGFTVYADAAPNARGVEDVLTAVLGGPLPTDAEVLADAQSGRLKALLFVNSNPDAAGTRVDVTALRAIPFLAVVDLFAGPIAALSHVLLPAASAAEKIGTFTNVEGHVQRLAHAVESPGQAHPEWKLLVEIYRRLGGNLAICDRPADTFAHLATQVPSYSGLTHDALGDGGRRVAAPPSPAPAGV
ncbi:MAG: (2Fe-2S)-binding protein [Planctomycetes bacterium]|nr:(2Fe-2S)-binding protein [Planctomycetota bacterium]MBI3846028.1 (2Fe-2S)-binding protein [Planctomycetota bacterium]